jgi:hypothetical protein
LEGCGFAEKLDEAQVRGAMVRIARKGQICSSGRMVRLEDVTVCHPGVLRLLWIPSVRRGWFWQTADLMLMATYLRAR